MILLFHTPYIFFNLKENIFVLYDEYKGTLSAQLEAKLVKLNKKNDNSNPLIFNKDLEEGDAMTRSSPLNL